MSYVHRLIDGTYEVGILYQDGYERSICPDREAAVKAYKSGMRFSGGLRDDIGAIPDPAIVDKGSWPLVVAEAPNGISIGDDRVRDAIRLALSRQRLDPGSRYEFRVSLVKDGGDEPYLGGGI